MSQTTKPLDINEPVETIRLDPQFKYEIAKEPGGESLKFCFQCGKCTASCPVRRLEEVYKPRQIIRAALLGLRKIVLSSDVIWLCATCFSCTERCPQGVKLTDVMQAIRNIAVKEGYIHQFFKAQGQMITNFGRIFEDEEYINELRDDLGLPPLEKVNINELTKILDSTSVKQLLLTGEE
jgi:heterodisulfide reductase subunit C